MRFLNKISLKRKTATLVVIAVALLIVADLAVNTFMMHGINRYYGLDQKSKILLIGHSHLMLGTDKKRLEKELEMPVSKYCREGVTVADRYSMIKQYLDSDKSDSLKYVLYGVDLYSFTGKGLSANSYKLFYPFIDNAEMDRHVREEAEPGDYWLHKLLRCTRFNDDGLKNSAFRGWLNNWDNMKFNTINIDAYRKELAATGERKIEMNDTIVNIFKKTVNLLKKRDVKVILVNTPTLDILNDYNSEQFKDISNWYKNFAASDSMVEYWDYNPVFSHDHSIFSDRLHLNSKGQQIITDTIMADLRRMTSIGI